MGHTVIETRTCKTMGDKDEQRKNQTAELFEDKCQLKSEHLINYVNQLIQYVPKEISVTVVIMKIKPNTANSTS
jgi:hypothetical protein